jgi:methylglutaconyl-CoA hydratase
MEDSILLEERQERVQFLSLNRPDKRNALNTALVETLDQALASSAEDQTVRAVVLRARGKVFSAGADLATLQQLQQNTFDDNLADSRRLKALFERMYRHPKPLIAQVEGHAIAGGCGLATVCDFIFSIPEAKFGYTEVRIGFVPAMVMVFLIRKIGEASARRLLLSGRLVEAREAISFGLLHELVAAEKIEERVRAFAASLTRDTSGEALARTRRMLAEIAHLPLEEALEYAARENAHARATEDCRRGIDAFLHKRELRW